MTYVGNHLLEDIIVSSYSSKNVFYVIGPRQMDYYSHIMPTNRKLPVGYEIKAILDFSKNDKWYQRIINLFKRAYYVKKAKKLNKKNYSYTSNKLEWFFAKKSNIRKYKHSVFDLFKDKKIVKDKRLYDITDKILEEFLNARYHDKVDYYHDLFKVNIYNSVDLDLLKYLRNIEESNYSDPFVSLVYGIKEFVELYKKGKFIKQGLRLNDAIALFGLLYEKMLYSGKFETDTLKKALINAIYDKKMIENAKIASVVNEIKNPQNYSKLIRYIKLLLNKNVKALENGDKDLNELENNQNQNTNENIKENIKENKKEARNAKKRDVVST